MPSNNLPYLCVFRPVTQVLTRFLWALLSLCPLELVRLDRAGLLARLAQQVKRSTVLEGM